MVTEKYIKRAKFEMNIIKKFEFETYFLILYDLMKWTREHEIPIGVARGSAAGSLVGYLLDLHRINPYDKRWDSTGDGLPFERFLDLNKLFAKYVFENGKEKMEFLENDDIKIIRKNKELIVKASEIIENDEIINKVV